MMKETNLYPTPTQSHESDWEETVWQAFKRGEGQAFADLVTLYYPSLLKYGLRLCVEPEYVKDCLHNLFLEIWNRRGRLDEIRSIKAYLFTSLRRLLYKETQRSWWANKAGDLEEKYDFQVQFAVESDIIEQETNHENLLRLKTHLQQLSKRQREAIYLRFYQDLSYEDIAHIMSINHHSAVNLIYESLKLLRKHWKLAAFVVLIRFL
jgi:RNA polymerase sigma factor (sigma-70 family)